MKSSSRRTVALIWSRRGVQQNLIRPSLPSAGTDPFRNGKFPSAVRFVGTTRAPDAKKKPTTVAAGTSTTRTIPYSTALLEDEDSDHDETDVVLPPLNIKPYIKNNNINQQNGILNHHSLRNRNGLMKPHNNEEEEHTAINTANYLKKCTCGGYINNQNNSIEEDNGEPLPPPLPPPVYSVHKRVLPGGLTALSSPEGRKLLQDSMALEMAESYWSLTEQFENQSDPAYCGVTTLLMVLNAMNVDPNLRWKGGWRYYGNEDVLLQRCCFNAERIRRVGITMEEFATLGQCHGMRITMKRAADLQCANSAKPLSSTTTPEGSLQQQQQQQSTTTPPTQHHFSLEDFRADIRQTLDSRINTQNAMLVTSFSRETLQQTGDGHFSPIAAYHEGSDKVLILDVARFKYPPYWVGVQELYDSMEPIDPTTQKPRGWYVMEPPKSQQYTNSYQMTQEDRRPAHLVPEFHEQEVCPVGEIKVQFCPAKNTTTASCSTTNRS